MAGDEGLDLDLVRERFAASTDFTIGLEEEFAIVDPETLELAHRFDEMMARCQEDEVLRESAAGELIDTEIEIRSGRAESFDEAVAFQRERRERLFALARELGVALAATGTHPWANYLEQEIIDTPHYNRLREQLRWVAQRNQTWSLHAHVGINDADRAIAVCDHMRELLPALLALSANSPFLDRRETGLHTIRTQIFTRTFPRCGVHEPFGDFAEYRRFIDALIRTNTIVEATELWWSVRPHHAFGTVEVRICDAQTRGEESFALAGLMSACVVQAALDRDEGVLPEPLPQREIEENLWRAIRYGLDGEMIDWRNGAAVVPTRSIVERLAEWTEPARALIGAEVELPERNGAQRAYEQLAAGETVEEIYAAAVAETQSTYVTEPAPAG